MTLGRRQARYSMNGCVCRMATQCIGSCCEVSVLPMQRRNFLIAQHISNCRSFWQQPLNINAILLHFYSS